MEKIKKIGAGLDNGEKYDQHLLRLDGVERLHGLLPGVNAITFLFCHQQSGQMSLNVSPWQAFPAFPNICEYDRSLPK